MTPRVEQPRADTEIADRALRAWARGPCVDNWYSDDYDGPVPRTEITKSDAAIRRDIRDECWWSPFVDSDRVTVTVDHAVATLSASVDDLAEYQAAIENTLAGGAVRAVNELTLRDARAKGAS